MTVFLARSDGEVYGKGGKTLYVEPSCSKPD